MGERQRNDDTDGGTKLPSDDATSRREGPSPVTPGAVSRRAVLRAGLVAGGAAALTSVRPFSGSATSGSEVAGQDAAENCLPGRGKFPSGVPGVPDLNTDPPARNPPRVMSRVPGAGGTVTTFQITYAPPITPLEDNLYWQELNKRLGVTLQPTFTPADSYGEKIAAVTASGDLPDLTLVWLDSAPTQAQAIEQGAYTDLTSYLTDDALTEYPNLAAFPPQLWKNVRVQGKIFGVPRPRYLIGNSLLWRQDWAEKLGRGQLRDAADFKEVAVAFAKGDPDGSGRQDTYGLGSNGNNVSGAFALSFVSFMFRVPNRWRLADGQLTYYLETDEFRQALAFARELRDAGAYHPDAASQTGAQANSAFISGQLGGYINAWYSAVGIGRDLRETVPEARTTVLVPPGYDGGAGVTWNAPGYFGFVAIPAKVGQDKERVKELLRILDYFAVPGPSEESRFLALGVEGVHYEWDQCATKVTEKGEQDRGDFNTLMAAPPSLSFPPSAEYPDAPEEGIRLQQTAKDLFALGIDNPVLGLSSATEVDKASELSQLETDTLIGVVAGRRPVDALDGLIRDWRGRGGDQIRQEYEEQLRNQ
jgi:putative aldouronate transport system substrate-binding protein